MQFIINLEKRYLIFVVVLVCFLFVAGLSAAVAPNPGHDASEVGSGTFGVGDFVFPDNLKVEGSLFLPTNFRGIFWGVAENYSKPHINYNSSNGLWISTGTTGKSVNVDGGDLVVAPGKNIGLGGVLRSTWPLGVVPGSCGGVVKGIGATGSVTCGDPLYYNYCSGQVAYGITAAGTVLCQNKGSNTFCSGTNVADGIDSYGNIHCKSGSVTCTVSLSADCITVEEDERDTWANCPSGRYAQRAKYQSGLVACLVITAHQNPKAKIQCCTPTVTCT